MIILRASDGGTEITAEGNAGVLFIPDELWSEEPDSTLLDDLLEAMRRPV